MKCSIDGEIVIRAGTMRDYVAMQRWHYRKPMVVAATRVLVAWHGNRRAGVIVEAMPVLSCHARDAATGASSTPPTAA